MDTRNVFHVLLLAFVTVGCQKEQPLCGDPIGYHLVTYQVVDATTGQDWFSAAGRTPADSLILLRSADQFEEKRAVKVGNTVRVGPVRVVNNVRSMVTHYLRFSARDVDTVVTTLRYGPVEHGPCEEFAPLREVEITYNGRPNTLLRAGQPLDSLELYERGGQGKFVQLRKRP